MDIKISNSNESFPASHSEKNSPDSSKFSSEFPFPYIKPNTSVSSESVLYFEPKDFLNSRKKILASINPDLSINFSSHYGSYKALVFEPSSPSFSDPYDTSSKHSPSSSTLIDQKLCFEKFDSVFSSDPFTNTTGSTISNTEISSNDSTETRNDGFIIKTEPISQRTEILHHIIDTQKESDASNLIPGSSRVIPEIKREVLSVNENPNDFKIDSKLGIFDIKGDHANSAVELVPSFSHMGMNYKATIAESGVRMIKTERHMVFAETESSPTALKATPNAGNHSTLTDGNSAEFVSQLSPFFPSSPSVQYSSNPGSSIYNSTFNQKSGAFLTGDNSDSQTSPNLQGRLLSLNLEPSPSCTNIISVPNQNTFLPNSKLNQESALPVNENFSAFLSSFSSPDSLCDLSSLSSDLSFKYSSLLDSGHNTRFSSSPNISFRSDPENTDPDLTSGDFSNSRQERSDLNICPKDSSYINSIFDIFSKDNSIYTSNSEYQVVLSVISLLKQQLCTAMTDLKKLNNLKNDSTKNPALFLKNSRNPELLSVPKPLKNFLFNTDHDSNTNNSIPSMHNNYVSNETLSLGSLFPPISTRSKRSSNFSYKTHGNYFKKKLVESNQRRNHKSKPSLQSKKVSKKLSIGSNISNLRFDKSKLSVNSRNNIKSRSPYSQVSPLPKTKQIPGSKENGSAFKQRSNSPSISNDNPEPNSSSSALFAEAENQGASNKKKSDLDSEDSDDPEFVPGGFLSSSRNSKTSKNKADIPLSVLLEKEMNSVPSPVLKKKKQKISTYQPPPPAVFNKPWSPQEQGMLEELLVKYPDEPISNNRWRKIAEELKTRTMRQDSSDYESDGAHDHSSKVNTTLLQIKRESESFLKNLSLEESTTKTYSNGVSSSHMDLEPLSSQNATSKRRKRSSKTKTKKGEKKVKKNRKESKADISGRSIDKFPQTKALSVITNDSSDEDMEIDIELNSSDSEAPLMNLLPVNDSSSNINCLSTVGPENGTQTISKDERKFASQNPKSNRHDLPNQVSKNLNSTNSLPLPISTVNKSATFNHGIVSNADIQGTNESIRESIIHAGYKCDNCFSEPIVGVRWHCVNCANPNSSKEDIILQKRKAPNSKKDRLKPKSLDFDLCDECMSENMICIQSFLKANRSQKIELIHDHRHRFVPINVPDFEVDYAALSEPTLNSVVGSAEISISETDYSILRNKDINLVEIEGSGDDSRVHIPDVNQDLDFLLDQDVLQSSMATIFKNYEYLA
ncbi:hypothetical protein BB560_000602 [Smittium megazygosporum]|uniref:Myb-like domain-containing protein n=1 Tax=Smittium megazygosporum TaxID=133381 RepID=A0A2T9ZK15_9FUNG|nr:hypothetical protein BB560_000602 [Smittium megazygosporum]